MSALVDELRAALVRSLEQYAGTSPNAVASGSKAQMMYFIEDAKKDIATLAERAAEAGRWSAEWHGKLLVAEAELTTLQSRLETANRSAGEWEDLHRELFNAVYACTDPADKVCGLHPGPERDELEAVIGRHKTVHRREGPYASSVSYKARLEAVEAERDEALVRARIADKDAEIATAHWQNQFEEQKARAKELQKALEHCDVICAHALEHYKGPVAMKIKREIAVHVRATLSPARTEEGKP